MVAVGIAKLPDNVFVLATTADACSMVTSCLFVYETATAGVAVR